MYYIMELPIVFLFSFKNKSAHRITLCGSEIYNRTSFIHSSVNYWQHYIVCHVLVSSESNMYQIIQPKSFKLDRIIRFIFLAGDTYLTK